MSTNDQARPTRLGSIVPAAAPTLTNQGNPSVLDELLSACKVISLDARISTWLGENDPQALIQVRRAIARAESALESGFSKGKAKEMAAAREAQQITALNAINERFDSITEMTYLTFEQEAAIVALLDAIAGTLMLRGRDRQTMRKATELQTLAGFLKDHIGGT